MNQFVTVITPMYRAANYLQDYCNMLLAQTYRPFEVIVCDDGSEDGSADLLRQYAEKFQSAGITLKVTEIPHSGQSVAFNGALKELSGEILTWIDADDCWEPQFLEKMVESLSANAQCGMTYCWGTILSDDGIKHDRIEFAENELFDFLFYERLTCLAGRFALRTSILYDCYPDLQIPNSTIGQNLQLLMPPASRTSCACVREELHTYRRHAASHSEQVGSYSENRKRIADIEQLYNTLIEISLCDRERYGKELKRLMEGCRKNLMIAAVESVKNEKKKDRVCE